MPAETSNLSDSDKDIFKELAEQGHSSAQCRLGELYYKGGEGVPRDFVKAYAWLTVAANKSGKARKMRDDVSHFLIAEQLTEARELAAQLRKQISEEKEQEAEWAVERTMWWGCCIVPLIIVLVILLVGGIISWLSYT